MKIARSEIEIASSGILMTSSNAFERLEKMYVILHKHNESSELDLLLLEFKSEFEFNLF